LVGGIANKPSDTIDFSVPGTTFTREDLNVDTLEARMVLLDKDAWLPLHGASKRYVDLTPTILNSSGTLVAHRYNIAAENTEVGGTGVYMINHTTAVTLTLPATPVVGDTIVITDISSAGAATNYITVARNGERIQGLLEDLVIDINSASIRLTYANSTAGWRLIA
jgi:hypothetical protein